MLFLNLMFLYLCSARFIKRLSNKTSFDGIWLISFFIYKFIADVCFKILKCERVNLNDGNYDYVSNHLNSMEHC